MDLLEKEWYIQAPWGRISIVAWGNCQDPPVLLCHGQLDSAASFRPLMRYLPPNFYYIGMELPGNGKSDRYLPGLMINSFDVLYAVKVVVDHFRWDTFVYIGHSFGSHLGKLYALTFPGRLSKLIELDPRPHLTLGSRDFNIWYHHYFTNYFKKYDKYNGSLETAPVYAREEAIKKLMENRGLTHEAANLILERTSVPVGEDSIKFIHDQRVKLITRPPFTTDVECKLYTSIQTPTLAILAEDTVKRGYFKKWPFATDNSMYPNKNYRHFIVEGNHDVHLLHPERVAPYITAFLLNGLQGLDLKNKL